jgi:hypothetical protein
MQAAAFPFARSPTYCGLVLKFVKEQTSENDQEFKIVQGPPLSHWIHYLNQLRFDSNALGCRSEPAT